LQASASRVFVHHAIVDYVVRVVVATRTPAQYGMPDVAQWVAYGASPRASLGLIAAGRAIALLRGRDYVLPQDVLDIAVDVLPHRMVLSYDAIADGIPAAHAVRRVLQTIPLPQVAPRQRSVSAYGASPQEIGQHVAPQYTQQPSAYPPPTSGALAGQSAPVQQPSGSPAVSPTANYGQPGNGQSPAQRSPWEPTQS
jgi:MoxR-like ATPase